MRGSEDVPLVFLEKEGTESIVRGRQVVGPVGGRTAVVVDDLTSSARTLAQTAMACRARGARRVVAAVTHGVFASRMRGHPEPRRPPQSLCVKLHHVPECAGRLGGRGDSPG
ncbi:hypothetical protein [Longibacter sp.]|uniref:hypothetical protein n=1 Tax=Longibacter sp. TaxID=2045415 RepID=UPI003EBCF1CA